MSGGSTAVSTIKTIINTEIRRKRFPFYKQRPNNQQEESHRA